jgi:outer membrane protein, heavy metal efflux system
MLTLSRAALLAAALIAPVGGAFAVPLTLEQAVTRAIAAAPVLRAGDAAVAAARAGRVQAAVRPNPTLSVEGENIAGTGNYSLLEQSEITASYSQAIERGGKRTARVALAERDIAAAEAASGVVRLDLAAQVQRAFLDVLLSDEAASIAADRLAMEHALQREAVRRVRAAKDPLFVETRAAARIAEARLAVELADRRRAATRAVLAAFWGGSGESVEVNGDPLAISNAIAAHIDAAEALAGVDATLAEAEIARAGAAIAYERTRATQDYTLSGGARYLRGTNDVALVAGITVPLGRSDRNQGNIARAQAEKQRIEFLADAARRDRLRQLTGLRAQADAAQARAMGLRREVIPRSARALAQVREGYARGGFTFRDMQDAADGIVSAQAAYLDALTELRSTQADIDRLTGRFDIPLAETPR